MVNPENFIRLPLLSPARETKNSLYLIRLEEKIFFYKTIYKV
ncbi:hypothetical protein LEP1GSC074_3456 [Leptospira noguchii str. Hook]|uniref:Uncharacterized protein n=3 Tax=Leptospira noguchii TaxID=28182 RepID=M6Y216_9LEPT|nr:hypothetical protein LEP1GSC041_3243 [Leptospira noguchii str. 2006001870]EMM99521.1 hypothetical protein LEP1GSC035_1163 [Leptospira noguchii str. 2007001578]EMO42333.1 hypothetical protein LEP1GSC186_4555 [Leptospira noguchii serovar Autumnalis str. ZUN142]EMO87740.1 hypothetical protein LEP1GSC024_3567 [Leptospira noguchii str. 2001034031]EMS83993.1 hypothetical protein LEP1GSC074_3456 [Leptospira noguchii str. Hook]